MKIFKSTDEPSAPNISQEEYMKIQEEVRKNPHIFKVEEIRKKEVKMDINQQKEPEISWKLPKELKLEEEIENDFNEHGKESKQRIYIEELSERELKTYYFDEIKEPVELEKKLFSFTDENIPKIENSQKATKTNDVTIDDVLKFWDNLGNNLSKENLKQLEELLGKVDIDNKEKQQILEQAYKRYDQEMNSNQNFANNNININNNLTINNNQKILSMNNYPNLMNFNNINQLQGAIINNVKQFPQNLDPNYLNQPQNLQNNLLNQKYPEMIQQQGNNQNVNLNINGNIANTIPNINAMNTLTNIPFSGFDPNLNPLNQLNNLQQVQMQNKTKSNIDQRMFMESFQRMNVSKYKTKPCRNYHSSTGCTRGDNCFFIHDPNFKGMEIQNFDPSKYDKNFPLYLAGFQQGLAMPTIPNLNPQMANQLGQMGQIGLNQMNYGLNLQQMMGLSGNINNINQNINKGAEEGDLEQLAHNNMINPGMMQNNMDNNYGVNGFGLNNNGLGMGQGINLPGYDYNYGVGIQGQNLNYI